MGWTKNRQTTTAMGRTVGTVMEPGRRSDGSGHIPMARVVADQQPPRRIEIVIGWSGVRTAAAAERQPLDSGWIDFRYAQRHQTTIGTNDRPNAWPEYGDDVERRHNSHKERGRQNNAGEEDEDKKKWSGSGGQTANG